MKDERVMNTRGENIILFKEGTIETFPYSPVQLGGVTRFTGASTGEEEVQWDRVLVKELMPVVAEVLLNLLVKETCQLRRSLVVPVSASSIHQCIWGRGVVWQPYVIVRQKKLTHELAGKYDRTCFGIRFGDVQKGIARGVV